MDAQWSSEIDEQRSFLMVLLLRTVMQYVSMDSVAVAKALVIVNARPVRLKVVSTPSAVLVVCVSLGRVAVVKSRRASSLHKIKLQGSVSMQNTSHICTRGDGSAAGGR